MFSLFSACDTTDASSYDLSTVLKVQDFKQALIILPIEISWLEECHLVGDLPVPVPIKDQESLPVFCFLGWSQASHGGFSCTKNLLLISQFTLSKKGYSVTAVNITGKHNFALYFCMFYELIFSF